MLSASVTKTLSADKMYKGADVSLFMLTPFSTNCSFALSPASTIIMPSSSLPDIIWVAFPVSVTVLPDICTLSELAEAESPFSKTVIHSLSSKPVSKSRSVNISL